MDCAAYQVGQQGSIPPSSKVLHGLVQLSSLFESSNVAKFLELSGGKFMPT